MAALNRVQIIGNLGRDPELRMTPTEQPVVTFSVAVHRRWKNAVGQTVEAVDWLNIEAWNRLAEICHQLLRKGSLVYLEGRLQTDLYEKDGETRSYTKVMLREMQLLESRIDGEPDLEE